MDKTSRKLKAVIEYLRTPHVILALRKVTVSLKELVDHSAPGRKTRSDNCSASLVRFETDTGMLTFATRCAGSKRGSWRQKIEFDDWDSFRESLGFEEDETFDFQAVMDRTKEKRLKILARVGCECPDFRFMGYAYLAYELGYGWAPPVDAPPNVKNPRMVGALCKHLLTVNRRFFRI